MSTKSAGLAVKMGYKNVRVMLSGIPGWQKTGGTLIASDKFVKYGNIVLIDLRNPAESAAGHIPRSVNIPFADLSAVEDNFPSSSAAPIVFYGNNKEASKAARIVQGWGYNTISVTTISSWTTAGNNLVSGPAAPEITWIRKLAKGEVGIAEFTKVAKLGAPDKCILDVRNTKELSDGMFTGAINIPLEELQARINELSDGRELLIHCATGARAEMAHSILENAALKSRFLIATINCEEGKCEIEE